MILSKAAKDINETAYQEFREAMISGQGNKSSSYFLNHFGVHTATYWKKLVRKFYAKWKRT